VIAQTLQIEAQILLFSGLYSIGIRAFLTLVMEVSTSSTSIDKSGTGEEYPGAGNTFTVTFENPGTYNYVCILHPWQTGSVVVEE
jgi:plastocyanin